MGSGARSPRSTQLVHVDTDFAGDPDDACALAMLLAWPHVEVVGVTTNLDADGGRAGCVRYLLARAGRTGMPVVAGATESTTTRRRFASTSGDPRHWPGGVTAVPSAPGAASELLARSIDRGVTVIAIGALTNLAQLESARPGSLAGVDVVVMGGWLTPPPAGYPQWGPEMDFNLQCDTRAAEVVFGAAAVTLVPLPVAIRSQLRGAHLARLRAAGPVGELLASQSEAHRDDNGFPGLAAVNHALPADLVNFHWDPVTAAVAVGWSGAALEPMLLRTRLAHDTLRLEPSPHGRATRVVTGIDVDDFAERWLASIETL